MRSRIMAGALASGLISCFTSNSIKAQELDNLTKDSIYIKQVEEQQDPPKVLHAEPLYIDLIRDLGARKGEKEWNFGVGMTDNREFDSYEALVEYEFAPIDRLGLEIEVPFTFYAPQKDVERDSIPANRMESLKLAAQWSFFVNERISTSMALGYIHEFEFSDFRSFGKPLIFGNIYNPFLIAAKRWGQNWHTLIYTGPHVSHHFSDHSVHFRYDINTNVHYMITGTRNFVGLEVNKSVHPDGDVDITFRPQMRIGIADNFLVGIVGGIPLIRENERLSAFLRVIWEPGHRKDHH